MMGINGRLFGGDAATVDLLAKLLSEAAIERSQNPSPATVEAYQTARNAYISAAPDSPMAQQQAAPAAATHMPIDTSWWDSDGYYHSS